MEALWKPAPHQWCLNWDFSNPIEDYCWGCEGITRIYHPLSEFNIPRDLFLCSINHSFHFEPFIRWRFLHEPYERCPHQRPTLKVLFPQATGSYYRTTLFCVDCLTPEELQRIRSSYRG